MKVLITYAATGAGHFKAAEAVYDYFRQHCKHIDVELIGALTKTNAAFRFTCNWGYLLLVKYAPLVWYWLFWLTYNKALRKVTRTIFSAANYLNAKNFSRLLIEEKFDFIISTHFLGSEISARLKRQEKINSKLITIITDFGVHPFWICEGTDIYVAASGLTKEQLLSYGIDQGRIKVFGIPINSKFLQQYNRDSLREKFGLERNKFTVLIATGSFGIGPIEEIVDLLHQDAQILVVCASNRQLYKRLRKKNYPFVSLFGFIDNIQELMSASDIIITKPGGLTISESLSLELLPIFITAIPGQETENIRILSGYNLGLYLKDGISIRNIILELKANPDKLNKAKENIYKIRKTDTLKELCNVVCQDSPGPAC